MGFAKVHESLNETLEISSVSDILEITDIGRDSPVLESIIEKDKTRPLGHSQSGVPRPFSHGVWFRGDQNINNPVIPSAYKLYDNNGIEAFDEKNAFQDLKLRLTNLDTKRYNSFELHCMMRHHGLPSRLLDWSENPLIALYFAVSTPSREQPLDDSDAVLTCLNAYRLNEVSCLTDDANPGMFFPDSVNVLMRSLMSEHTKIIDIADRMKRILLSNETNYSKRVINFSETLKDIVEDALSVSQSESNLSENQIGHIKILFEKMRYAAAVVPKRNNLRMAAQLSNFTVHGGKLFGESYWDSLKEAEIETSDINLQQNEIRSLNKQSEMFRPLSLDELNLRQSKKFLTHFRIRKDKREKIRLELERLSINNASLFPEFDNQAKFVRTRWIKYK